MRKLIVGFALLAGLMLSIGGTPQIKAQDTIRVMTYNLLRYGASGINCSPVPVTTRNPWFTSVMAATMPDIFGVNEIGPFSGPTSPANNALINILQPLNPAYEATQITYDTYTNNQDVANMMYYNSDVVGLASQAVIPETNSIRDLNYYKFYYKGPGLAFGDTTFIEIVQVHLHSSAENVRAAQTASVMAYLNGLGRAGNFIVQGDMNLDRSTSGSFQNMVAYANPDCKMNDPLGLTGTWHNNGNVNHVWTQSTRSSGSNCGSGGGLDDRFDIILASNALMNNSMDMQILPATHWVVGNPNSPNAPIDGNTQAGIIGMSDHHPVTIDVVVSKAVANEVAQPQTKYLRVNGNPANSSLSLSLDLRTFAGQNAEVILSDLSGKAVRHWNLRAENDKQSIRYDISDLSQGAYFIRLNVDQNLLATQKVIVLGE